MRREEYTVGEGKDAIPVRSVGSPPIDNILWCYMILLHGGEHNIPDCYWHQRPAGMPPPERRRLRSAA
jgi:hypothetical protein